MFGQYYNTDELQRWFINNLPKARTVLSEFTILNSLFSSFKDYEKKKYEQTKNIILHMCLPNFDGTFKNTEKLAKLEQSLLDFDMPNWGKGKKKNLRNKLCNDNYYVSLSAYTELAYTGWLLERVGKNKIEIYPKLLTGKYSDILVKLESKNVYLEIGNLSKSKPEEKIENILDISARYLGSKLVEPIWLRLEVDTIDLLVLDSKRQIDENASVIKLNSEIDRLCLNRIADFQGFFFLDAISYVVNNEKLLKSRNHLLDSRIKASLDLINSTPLNKWVDSCRAEIAKGSNIISGIIGNKSEYLRVEIHPERFYPSLAHGEEQESFIDHIIRRIKDKLNQLQPNSPNIIVVQGYNWTIGFGEDLWNIEPLYTAIKDFLRKNIRENLCGIGVLVSDFDKTRFIHNEYVGEAFKLESTELAKLGLQQL